MGKENQINVKGLNELSSADCDITRFELAGVAFEINEDSEVDMKELGNFLSKQTEYDVTLNELKVRFEILHGILPAGSFTVNAENADGYVQMLVECIF